VPTGAGCTPPAAADPATSSCNQHSADDTRRGRSGSSGRSIADRSGSLQFLYRFKAGPAGGRLRRPSSAGRTAAGCSSPTWVRHGHPRSATVGRRSRELCHPRMPGCRTWLPKLSAGSIPVTRSTRKGPDQRRRSLGVGCLPFAVRRSRVRYWAKVEPLCDCEHASSKVKLGYSGRQFQRGS
jgi:hypothetical protein